MTQSTVRRTVRSTVSFAGWTRRHRGASIALSLRYGRSVSSCFSRVYLRTPREKQSINLLEENGTGASKSARIGRQTHARESIAFGRVSRSC
ncbi:unnamed protein product [Sphagnum troendelagicum]|uniref:Ribosomal protein L20 n=1 Tax=Sphagnum troendelagicum TaxID=128251 RepID=A0ABP0TDW4_9BRYO